MCEPHPKFRNLFPQMESVVRVSNIPVIENGLKFSGKLYTKLKKNPVLNWPLSSAESLFFSSAELIKPLFDLIQEPVTKVDNLLCKTLDFVELKIPSVYLPPEMIYLNTKEYMSDHIVRPVLKRANSVKQIGTVASCYATDRIDGAIDVADLYVDKYLPSEDATDTCDSPNNEDMSKAVHTFQKGKQFSRKLKRRLTQRTVAEAKALKKQSKEAIHILVYATELVLTNPKQAIIEVRKLWNYLSDDEPENQARPQTLEQLIVLLTRESARKLVHVTNYLCRSIGNVIFKRSYTKQN
ncbi:lipid storage droplets surface-binding protein 1 isoform X2 [Bradysia coprophila]|uniref:lipid storage droplets surface-binding protein 1 isoform X2 n=1 Tax=Bradysia coprophila TaxID=38358 RepID=UPI00187DB6D8|nr:lipid storage droplets surface-binding protein 1 isoform X2 [Bradysia coprophila]